MAKEIILSLEIIEWASTRDKLKSSNLVKKNKNLEFIYDKLRSYTSWNQQEKWINVTSDAYGIRLRVKNFGKTRKNRSAAKILMTATGAKSCEDDDFKLWFEGLRTVFPKNFQQQNHSTMILEGAVKQNSFQISQTKWENEDEQGLSTSLFPLLQKTFSRRVNLSFNLKGF